MQPKRILIVDDAPEFAHLIQDALATISLPLETSVFLSGEEAWLEALKTRFDLVITDLRLPGIPGTELVRRLRSRYPEIKIIAVSGLAEAGLNERTRAAGVDAFYRKPVEFPLLLTKIDNLLNEFFEDDKLQSITGNTAKVGASPQVDAKVKPRQITKAEVAAMRQLEEHLVKYQQYSGAEGVAVSTSTGFILAGFGSAADFKPESNLVEICAMLNAIQKRGRRLATDHVVSKLLVFPAADNDLIIDNLGKFIFWILFKAGSAEIENGKALVEWSAVKRSFLSILTSIELLPVPRQPHPPEKTAIITEMPADPRMAQTVEENEPAIDTDDLPKSSLSKKEVNAFWDKEAQKIENTALPSDVISFDKASSLGLFPEDEK